MLRIRSTLLLLACLVAVPGVAHAGGGIYKYVQPDGTIVYTNVRPSRRAHAHRLKGSFKPAPRPQDAPAPRQVSAEEFDQYVHDAAIRYKIPEPLVWAVMHAESNFNAHAVSQVGASGLMQLMPATAQQMYVKDIFDVRDNIEGGTRYLRVLANMFDGDMVKMVAAYNAGPDAVKKYNGQVPPYAETQAYVRKVLKLYYQYKAQRQAKGADPELATAQDAGLQGR